MANDITVDRGTTYAITHVYQKDGAPSSDGQTLYFTVKQSESDLDDTDASALGALKKDITMSGATNVVTIDPIDTLDILPGKYWYDLKVKDISGDIYRVVKGRFILDASPTNRGTS